MAFILVALLNPFTCETPKSWPYSRLSHLYRDDAEKLHSDLIGINAISLEDALEDAMDVAASDTSASASSGAENSDLKTERSASIDFLKQQVGKYYFFDCKP